ncbi:hypothetical protein [Aestuariivirga sp.]
MESRQQSYGQGVVFVLLATLGWSLSGLFVRPIVSFPASQTV